MRKISAKIGVTALSAFALFAVSIPQAYGANFVVNCNTPKSLQDALDQASDGDTFTVVGGSTCLENIVVRLDHVTLDGNGTATIDGSGDVALTTVVVNGTGVTITGFTITGGRRGILVQRGASAVITEVTITNAEREGIQVTDGSAARIERSTIMNVTRNGITVNRASAVRVKESTITSNAGSGISVSRVSDVDIEDSTISENSRQGISIRSGSHADIEGSTITGNGIHGVLAIAANINLFGDPNFIVGNNNRGVICLRISILTVSTIQDFGDPLVDPPNGDGNTFTPAFPPDCLVVNSANDPFFP